MLPELCECRLRGESREGEDCSECRILLSVGTCQVKESRSDLWMFFLPERVAATRFLSSKTDDPCAPFMKPQLDSMTIPAKDRFRLASTPLTILYRHIGLKRASRGIAHL